MAAGTRKNPYKGKVSISINGYSVEELGATYVQAVVADWFVRSMFRTQRDKPEHEYLSRWEYLGIDCEQFNQMGGSDV